LSYIVVVTTEVKELASGTARATDEDSADRWHWLAIALLLLPLLVVVYIRFLRQAGHGRVVRRIAEQRTEEPGKLEGEKDPVKWMERPQSTRVG
jgi:hypothetical protein